MSESRIPIRNLYYLLCYSWNQLEQGELIDVTRCPSTELVDLFALVLCDGVNHLARRGIEQGYELRHEELSSLRGRIDALGSARRFLPMHGRAACTFDELTPNTLNNQILKATLRLLCRADNINAGLKDRAMAAYRGLHEIDDIALSLASFKRIQLHANTGFYKFLLNVCELVVRGSLVDQQSGSVRFRDFVRDERTMAYVFEGFLFNFIRLEVKGAHVKRERIWWLAQSATDPDLSLLPSMNTDISARKGDVRLIIDAKYYSSSVSLYRDSTKLHSANLYQLMSYLTNSPRAETEELRGMLIYPRVDRTLRSEYVIQGFPVSVGTVDLNRDWQDVRTEVMELVEPALQAKQRAFADAQ